MSCSVLVCTMVMWMHPSHFLLPQISSPYTMKNFVILKGNYILSCFKVLHFIYPSHFLLPQISSSYTMKNFVILKGDYILSCFKV